MTNDLSHRATGFGAAAAAAIIVNLLLVLAKETSPAVMAGMNGLGHHWVTHGAVVLLVFVGLGLGLARGGIAAKVSAAGLTRALIAAAAIGGGGIVAFYGYLC